MPESHIDLAFHAVIWEPEAYRRGDLAEAAALGVGSVKLWLAYVELGIMADDDVALAVMQEAAELGIVALAHCENGRAVDLLTRQCVAEGRLGIESLPASRPIELEAECVHRFLVLAGLAGATPYVVHVTGREPLDEILAARRRGQTVHARGVPAPPALRALAPRGPGRAPLCHDAAAARRPPIARRSWRVCGRATSTTYASDHCHLRLDRDKVPVQDDFTKIPTGLPGIGARLPLGFALGGADDPLSVERLVDAACTQPARIFGLYPRKGSSRREATPTSSSGIPRAPTRLTLELMNDGLDWTPYDGIEVPGRVRDVLARGERVVDDGRWVGDEHRGEYLPVARVLETA